MHIAIDARPLCGNKTGIGFYTYNLVENLARIDTDNTYYLYSTSDFNGRFFEHKNFIKRRHRFPPSNIWLQTALPFQLKKDRIDLFHGTNFLVPIMASCKSAITVHDLTSFFFPHMHKLTNNMVQRLVPISIKRCSKIIAVSYNTKKDIVNRLNVNEEKVAVIYEAVNRIFRFYEDRLCFDVIAMKYNLPRKFILFVGTLEPRKNIKKLIISYKLLRSRGFTDTKLVIIGDKGWYFRHIFREVFKHGISDSVMFLNYIPAHDLAAIYNMAELFVFLSVYEGFGLPPLEAMACGTPVITSNNSSFPEIIGGAGIMVEPHDETAVCNAMEKVLTDDNLKNSLRKKGLERASFFSWERAAYETLKIYNRLI